MKKFDLTLPECKAVEEGLKALPEYKVEWLMTELTICYFGAGLLLDDEQVEQAKQILWNLMQANRKSADLRGVYIKLGGKDVEVGQQDSNSSESGA